MKKARLNLFGFLCSVMCSISLNPKILSALKFRFRTDLSTHRFIDALIDSTKTLIEQKSSNVNLDNEEIFLQAKRYNDALEYSRKARWIVTCNFKEFRVFDMDKRYPEREPLKISLFELPKKFSALNFLVELQDKISYERELSIQSCNTKLIFRTSFAIRKILWRIYCDSPLS